MVTPRFRREHNQVASLPTIQLSGWGFSSLAAKGLQVARRLQHSRLASQVPMLLGFVRNSLAIAWSGRNPARTI